MAEHTPGPWTVMNRSSGHIFEHDWRSIEPHVVEAGQYTSCRFGEDESHCGVVISEANGRLIAAAPDLLAACEAAYRLHRLAGCDPCNWEGGCEYWKPIVAAIARARGEQP